jgi:hypothetical protein
MNVYGTPVSLTSEPSKSAVPCQGKNDIGPNLSWTNLLRILPRILIPFSFLKYLKLLNDASPILFSEESVSVLSN